MDTMQTILVTGAGRGLGRVTAEKLAAAGHHVVLHARRREAAEAAVTAIKAAHPSAVLTARAADLSAMAGVRALADELLATHARIDAVLHIAGVMQQSETRRMTAEGIEETLAVNTLAPFLLSGLLIPALAASPAGRIVNVSSRRHLPDSHGAPVDFDLDDPMEERGYDPDRAYKNSKLAVLWVTYGQASRSAGRSITANAVCPGFVPMTASDSATGVKRIFMRTVLARMPFAVSVDAATDSFVFMATDPALDGVSGAFYGERHPIESSPESHDAAKAAQFWAMAERLTGFAWPT
jgi:NAD(P)-dependent dehydrogenase (short-subunit alcohol dehydrogenase family)